MTTAPESRKIVTDVKRVTDSKRLSNQSCLVRETWCQAANRTSTSLGRPKRHNLKGLKMGKNQHVVPHGNGWAVKGAGNSRVTSNHNTQAEAARAAREIAINQKSEVLIHRPNGQIRDRDSYGNDPYPPKG